MTLAFRKLHPHFAAEANAIDLRRVHDAPTLAQIREAMDQYAVVVFRDQPFTNEEQLDFAERVMLMELTEHATQPQFVYRHAWRLHDFVIWDNRATMHRGRPYDDIKHRRELVRATILDIDRPAA